ncbi:hypothetical protein GIB67_014538, partial [Kingdonia uniflora]
RTWLSYKTKRERRIEEIFFHRTFLSLFRRERERSIMYMYNVTLGSYFLFDE